jgi:4-diphosphocytidyl-2-C-methyl-D-erythritol kinase
MAGPAAGTRRAAAYHRLVVTVTPVTARVPAKVNLQLAVGPPRADGYHDLVTVFHAVSLFDEVTVRPADRTKVVVTGTGAGSVPSGQANLAARAATALARATRSRRHRGKAAVLIEIRKRIPVAAGLAGGSADAAAALVACNELWRAGASAQDLQAVAAEVGSDVPFALLGGTAVGQGRGEHLSAALVTGAYHWVLAFAAGGLSTPEVYAAYDRLRAARAAEAGPSAVRSASAVPSGPAVPSGADARSGAAAADADALAAADARSGPGPAVAQPQLSTALMAALRSGDPAAVGAELTNDLQAAAVSLRPDLRRTLTAGRQLGALGAMVSGSGPTCAFLARDAAQARDLAVSLTGAGVCRSVVSVQGPVGGAAVLTAGEPA